MPTPVIPPKATAAQAAAGTNDRAYMTPLRTAQALAGGGSRTTFSNADYSALATDRYIAQTGTMSAVRTVTLPAASSVPAGKPLTIADESGTVTEALRIVISRAGSDTINGATSIAIAAPYGRITIYSDGVDSWAIDQPVPLGRAKQGSTTWLSVPGIDFASVGTITMIADRIYYGPWFVASPITIDRLVFEVSSPAAAGKLIRGALYRADVNWQPTDLLADTGNIAADATGVKTYDVSLVLQPGRYLASVRSDGTPAVRSVRGGNVFMGLNPSLGATAAQGNHRCQVAFGAYADPGVAWTEGDATSGLPSIPLFCRISTP